MHFQQLLPIVSTVSWSLECSDESAFHQRLQNGARTSFGLCLKMSKFFKRLCKMLSIRYVEMIIILEISRTFNLRSSVTKRRICLIIFSVIASEGLSEFGLSFLVV